MSATLSDGSEVLDRLLEDIEKLLEAPARHPATAIVSLAS
jgi:hypothetical protein